MLVRVHVFVSGRVQGVAYRFFVERLAADIPMTGWVRNLRDGRVEVIAEGEKTDLENFLGELRRGPRLARVDDLDFLWEDYRGEFRDFQIRATPY